MDGKPMVLIHHHQYKIAKQKLKLKNVKIMDYQDLVYEKKNMT